MACPVQRDIVIVGGGIMGCTTAYYLSRHPKFIPSHHRIILLEATAIAANASGKSGGLLALWAYPDCLVPLSFRLHAELAAEHDGASRWGYRQLSCGSVSAKVAEADIEAQRKMSEQLNGGVFRADGGVVKSDEPATSSGGSGADGGGSGTDGDDNAELPIQSVLQHEVDNKDTKDWEKLQKQDDVATGLLHDSPLPVDLDWIDGDLVQQYRVMGPDGLQDTAQVHPFQFTTAMAQLAAERGVDIRLMAKVTKINSAPKTGVRSVEYVDRQTGESHTIDNVSDVVVTAGPWTGKLLPRTNVQGLRAHSVVYEADVTPYAVFTNINLPLNYVPEHRARMGQKRKHKANVDPEIYARPFNEVYACGEPDKDVPLPETADQVQCDEAQCDDMIAYIGTISTALRLSQVKTKQACYLPQHIRFDKEYGPLIGQTSVPHLWVAAGHTCWGIQNGPATGYLMAEMILDGKARSANIDRLDPGKFKV